MSLTPVLTMTLLTIMEYLCHKWPRICSTCRKQFNSTHKKSLKILKGYSKDVSTDNTMAKRQREKEQTTNITQQAKDRATRTLLKKSLKIPKGQSETVYRKRTVAIVLSVLTSFEYPFSIFKLFLCVLLNSCIELFMSVCCLWYPDNYWNVRQGVDNC
jgi:hypothetical protein